MIIALSVPTGYHMRELLVPLQDLLTNDEDIDKVLVLTPAADFRKLIFPEYSDKFIFHHTPDIDTATEIFTKYQPDLVVTDTTGLDDYDVPILRAATSLNITTATFIASWDNIWKINRHKEEQAFADHFIVWNQMMKDHLPKVIPDPDSKDITVIGAPRFDFFTHSDRIPSREELFRHLGLTDFARPLIHFATTELYPLDYIVKSIFQSKLKQQPHLFASVHPGGNMTHHKTELQAYDVTIRYSFGRHESSPHKSFMYRPSKKDVYMHMALFKHADLLINHSSTVALESFAADTPVINVKYAKPWHWLSWYRSIPRRDFDEHYADLLSDNPSKVVTNEPELIQATNDYLSDPTIDQAARKSTLSKMNTITDGTASRKMLDHLKQLATKHE